MSRTGEWSTPSASSSSIQACSRSSVPTYEREMVESRPEGIEVITSRPFMVVQPNERSAVVTEHRYLSDVCFHRPDELKAEHSLVPVGAGLPVPHGKPEMHRTIKACHILPPGYSRTLYSATIQPWVSRSRARPRRDECGRRGHTPHASASFGTPHSSCFFDQGYAATSMEAIARRAGVSVATIYQAFGTKQGASSRGRST